MYGHLNGHLKGKEELATSPENNKSGKNKSEEINRHSMYGHDLALDKVKPGDGGESSFGRNGRAVKQLPDGITSAMLYRDSSKIAFPSMTEFLLTQLTSMADLMMVGKLGPWAIAAVGYTVQPKFLMMTVFMAMNVGATAMVARYKGAGEPHKANMILRQALLLNFVLGIAASVIGYAFSGQMVRFMGAVDEMSLIAGTTYMKIQMAGFTFFALTSTITATLRGVGNSRTAMTYNTIANVINIILNYLLIFGKMGFPEMGVAGASLATLIAQMFAFGYSVTVILKGNRYLYIKFRDSFRPSWEAMAKIFKIGVPAMLEQLVMRAGQITFTKIVASLGTIDYATHHICMSIQALSFMNGQAFAVSATSLTGQSLGKKRPDMAQAYNSRTRRLGMTVSILLGSLIIIFARQLMSFYTDDVDVIMRGARILRFVALIQPLQSSQFILAGALRGAGDTKSIAVITLITILIIRPVAAYINVYILGLGLEGAWLGLVADQLIRSGLVMARYYSGKWKRIRI